jgi:hypothetical protein
MGWLWSGRGKPRSRPRVARAIGEARDAHAGVTLDLGGATALLERAVWSHDLPAAYPAPRVAGRENGGAAGTAHIVMSLGVAGASAPTRRDSGTVDTLLERAEDTARRLGRSRAEMWEEALGAWLETQLARADVALDLDGDLNGKGLPSADTLLAPRPWLFEARRQRVWGEIDETLGALRTA